MDGNFGFIFMNDRGIAKVSNSEQSGVRAVKWKLSEQGELHVYQSRRSTLDQIIEGYTINPDESLTHVANIENGDRIELGFDTFNKVK